MESNWKDKISAITIASSLDLDKLNEDEELMMKMVKSESKLFHTEENLDPVFDLNPVEQQYYREPPDFVIQQNIIYFHLIFFFVYSKFDLQGRKMHELDW